MRVPVLVAVAVASAGIGVGVLVLGVGPRPVPALAPGAGLSTLDPQLTAASSAATASAPGPATATATAPAPDAERRMHDAERAADLPGPRPPTRGPAPLDAESIVAALADVSRVSRAELRAILAQASPDDPAVRKAISDLAASAPVGPPGAGLARDAVDEAVLALGRRSDAWAELLALLGRPETDRTAVVALACFIALGKGDPGAARAPLAARLRDLVTAGVTPATRRTAGLALARADAGALLALPAGSPEVEEAVVNALPTLCAAGLEGAISRARDAAQNGASPEVRLLAVRVVACAPEPARRAALEAIAGGLADAPPTRLARELLAGPAPAATPNTDSR